MLKIKLWQALKVSNQLIKLLASLQMKKLDLKHYPKQRSKLEIAFSTNKCTKNILKDYSTQKKGHRTEDKLNDTLVHTTAYALMDKSTRVNTMMYKYKGTTLLKILHIKCASVDSVTKLRAKMAFINCRICHEETAINFLTRLEQMTNEAYNYDMEISEKEFKFSH